jgi:hypothetical protein
VLQVGQEEAHYLRLQVVLLKAQLSAVQKVQPLNLLKKLELKLFAKEAR